jgi:hypothetical protein
MLFELMVFTSVSCGIALSLAKLGSLGLGCSYKLGSTSFNYLKQLVGFPSKWGVKKKGKISIKKASKTKKTKLKAFERINYFFHGASMIIRNEINGIPGADAFIKIKNKNKKALMEKPSKLKLNNFFTFINYNRKTNHFLKFSQKQTIIKKFRTKKLFGSMVPKQQRNNSSRKKLSGS